MKALICLLKIHLYFFVVPGVWGRWAGAGEATNVTRSCPEGEGIAEGFRAGLGRLSPKGPESGYLQLCGPCGLCPTGSILPLWL